MDNTIEKRIKNLGLNVLDFDKELLDGYKTLLDAKIDIPDTLLDAEMCKGFFGMYCLLIAENETSDLRKTIPYLRSGMSFRHCKLITNAIKLNDKKLLSKYDVIFSNKQISKQGKYNLAKVLNV